MLTKEDAKRIATAFAHKNNWPWSDDITVKHLPIPIIGGFRVVARVPAEFARVEIRLNAFGTPNGGKVRYKKEFGPGA